VRGDARRLRQVFDHLLDNAIKFSPNGGTICLSLGEEGDMVCVQVQDQGIGLPTDELERVFDRFYQVDGSATRRFGGTGLGLALVKEVVEAHGGAVWVESEVGQGSTFTLFLPCCPEGTLSPNRGK
jgi:signal transduction histidine kinase